MSMNYIFLPSYWGREVRHRYISNNSSTLVVVFPGKNYSCELPLLYYSAESAMEYQHDVLLLEYGYQSARTDPKSGELSIVVEECKKAIKELGQYQRLMFISKSLGTIIAGQVAEEFGNLIVNHIFLTPLKDSVPYILKSKGIVIYGTKDPLFNEQNVKDIKGHNDIVIHPILEATHSLEVENVSDSLLIIREILDLYRAFFSVNV